MHGYPKTPATKADFQHLLADEAFRTQALSDMQTLLDERYGWILIGKLAEGDEGNTSSVYRVDEIKDNEGTVTERYQLQWGITTTTLDRMGITVADAVSWGCVDREIAAPEA